MDISIGNNHLKDLLQRQYVLEWLASERTATELALAHLTVQLQRETARLRLFLAEAYQLSPDVRIELDAEAGFIRTLDVEPGPQPESAPETEPAPESEREQVPESEPVPEPTPSATPIPQAEQAERE